MSGFLCFLFALLFTVAFGLAIFCHQEKKRRRLVVIVAIACIPLGAGAIIAGWIYYLSPAPPTVIQKIGPPEKPYMFVNDSRMDELAADKPPTVMLEIQNGPTESVLIFRNTTWKLTPFVPEKYLNYIASDDDPQTIKFAPHQTLLVKWTPHTPIITPDKIEDLNASPPRLELYIFARGEYSDENGKHPFNVCWKYDREFPTHIAICKPDVKIE
jgi:hypothetical protein